MKRILWKAAASAGVLAAAPLVAHYAPLAYGTHRFGIH